MQNELGALAPANQLSGEPTLCFSPEINLEWPCAANLAAIRVRTGRSDLRFCSRRPRGLPAAQRRSPSRTLYQQDSQSSPPLDAVAGGSRGAQQKTKLALTCENNPIHANRFGFRIRIPTLLPLAGVFSEDLCRSTPPPSFHSDQDAHGKCVPPRLHYPPDRATECNFQLLRPLRIQGSSRKIRQRCPRFFQNAPLRRRLESRSSLPRVHLFGDEDVPRPLLQELQRSGLSR